MIFEDGIFWRRPRVPRVSATPPEILLFHFFKALGPSGLNWELKQIPACEVVVSAILGNWCDTLGVALGRHLNFLRDYHELILSAGGLSSESQSSWPSPHFQMDSYCTMMLYDTNYPQEYCDSPIFWGIPNDTIDSSIFSGLIMIWYSNNIVSDSFIFPGSPNDIMIVSSWVGLFMILWYSNNMS